MPENPNRQKECNQGKTKKFGGKWGGCKLKRAPTIAGKKSRYCYNHGCLSCNFKNLKTNTTSSGIGCCEECKQKLEDRENSASRNLQREKDAKINEFQTRNEQLITEIKNVFSDFWEKVVKIPKEKLTDLVKKSIKDERGLGPQAFYHQSWRCIENLLSLDVTEKEKWGQIYHTFFSDFISLNNFFELEKNFLVPLAQKYKDAQEQKDQSQTIPECKNCNFRRQQPTTFPASCEGWCHVCIEQRENKKPNPSPQPLPNPSPNPQLVSTKQKIQSQYKLSSAEFNSVIKPLTDLELLQAVAKLINKVKTNSPTTDSDTRLEFLVAYQAAPSGSLKNQAYQAVNSYQQQVDHLISSLQAQKTKRKSSLRELVQALDEQALNQAYQLIQQDPELYQAQNKSLIDNHQKRVASALQITAQNQASPLAQDLATILRTIVASDSSKEDLLSLEQKIKEYQTAQGEKQVLYQQHSSIINQMVQEIKTELTRRHNSEEEQQDNPPPSSHTTPQPTSPLTIFLITLTGITLLLTISYLYWQKKKKKQWVEILAFIALTKKRK